MKKRYVLILILILTVGFASINTVLDLKGNVSIGFKEDDFNVIISKVIMDDVDVSNIISDDKQSFTFTGTGSNKIEYTITNKSYQYDANINLICEPNNNLLINQVGEVVAQSRESETIEANTTGSVTCRMDIDKISKTEIAEDMCEYEEGQTWEFDYTGREQEFVVPCDGEYKLETWGAQGGYALSNDYKGGYGGFSFGEVFVRKNLILYLNIGGEGINGITRTDRRLFLGGYNGGGHSFVYGNKYVGSGGGATHISTKAGVLSTLDKYKGNLSSNSKYYESKDIFIVAGGGGGSSWEGDSLYGLGGSGGGFIGGSSSFYGYKDRQSSPGGSQLYGGDTAIHFVSSGFGQGASQNELNGDGQGSGGGFFGGGLQNGATGGGGSGYIGNPLLTNKAMYCYNCATSNEEATKTISTTCTSLTPIANCAKQGHGYAKITYLG